MYRRIESEKAYRLNKRNLVRKAFVLTLILMMVFTLVPWLAPGEWYEANAASDICSVNGTWGSWTTTVPESGVRYQSRTEYRYKDRLTKTATSQPSTPSGYTYSSYASSGTYTDYGAWSGWSRNAVSSSTTRKVETRPTYRYYYWYCSGCGGRDPFGGACSHCGRSGLTWQEAYHTVSGYNMGYSTSNEWTGRGRVTWNGAYWWFELNGVDNGWTGTGQPTITEYRYADRQPLYNYYYWPTSWTSWSTSSVTSSSTRQVDTRTTYRVWTPGPHTWDSGTVTTEATCTSNGTRTATCTSCGETQSISIPKLGHTWDSGTVAKPAGYTYTGIKVHICTTCRATKSVAIAKKNAAAVTPARVVLSSAKVSGKKLTLAWKRIAKNTKGYQVAIKNKKTKKVTYHNAAASSKSKISKKIKLKKGTYAVMVRAYNKINGETVYGPWSKVKAGKIK